MHASEPAPAADRIPLPDPRDRTLTAEREVAKLVVQAPDLVGVDWYGLAPTDFRHPAYAGLFAAGSELAAGYTGSPAGWGGYLRDHAGDPVVRQLVASLAVEPLRINREPDRGYVAQNAAAVQLRRVSYDIDQLRSRLQRINPVEHGDEHRRLFADLLALEARKRDLNQLWRAEGTA